MLNTKELEQVKKYAPFQYLSDGHTVSCLRACKTKTLLAGEMLYQTGTKATHLYVVLEGVILIVRGDPSNLAIMSLREPGSMAGLTATMCQNAHYASALSTRSSKVLSIPSQVLAELISLHPPLSTALMKSLADNTQDVAGHFERLQNLKTSVRLADYLLTLVNNCNCPSEFTLPCDKGVIARYLGMERESFSRALKKLQDVGVRSQGRRVILQDPAALRRLCAKSDISEPNRA